MAAIAKSYKLAPAVRELAMMLTRHLPPKNWARQVQVIHAFVRDRIRYTRDVRGVETLQTPIQTLRLGQGDCDDKAILVSALLESIGHPTRFEAVGFSPNVFSHVLAQTKIAGRWISLETTEPWPMGRHPKGVKASMIVHVKQR